MNLAEKFLTCNFCAMWVKNISLCKEFAIHAPLVPRCPRRGINHKPLKKSIPPTTGDAFRGKSPRRGITHYLPPLLDGNWKRNIKVSFAVFGGGVAAFQIRLMLEHDLPCSPGRRLVFCSPFSLQSNGRTCLVFVYIIHRIVPVIHISVACGVSK